MLYDTPPYPPSLPASPLMQLFDPRRPLVHAPVDGRRHGQRAADDGAHAGQEADEGLGALFAVDHFHGGDVLVGTSETPAKPEKRELGNKTYVGEEHARDAAPGVQALLVALGGVGAATQAALVARDGVLVRFDAAVLAVAVAAEGDQVRGVGQGAEEALGGGGAEGDVGGRDDLDEVHVVEGRVVGGLGGGVERVEVVVRPRQGGAHVLGHLRRELGPEA